LLSKAASSLQSRNRCQCLTRPPWPTPQDKADDKLVTFCTGVRSGDTLMPMWCGTDYDNEKSRACASYFNMLYEVRAGSAGGGGSGIRRNQQGCAGTHVPGWN
jgi:hypothetical protein